MVRSAFGLHFDADLELPKRLDAHFEAYLVVDRAERKAERKAEQGKDCDARENQGRHNGTLLPPAARSSALLQVRESPSRETN